MSDQDFNDNTGTAEVEDGVVDGTAGVEDEDAAAPWTSSTQLYRPGAHILIGEPERRGEKLFEPDP